MYLELTFQVCTQKIAWYLTNVWQQKFAQSSQRLKPNLQDLRREEHSTINLLELHWHSFKRYWQCTYWIVNLLRLCIHNYLGIRLWKFGTNDDTLYSCKKTYNFDVLHNKNQHILCYKQFSPPEDSPSNSKKIIKIYTFLPIKVALEKNIIGVWLMSKRCS